MKARASRHANLLLSPFFHNSFRDFLALLVLIILLALAVVLSTALNLLILG
jgi:hypothetical protein